jgi:hypothetical protein
MDFKSLISKIEAIDGKVETPKSPELPKTIKLDEDAEMRVLSGTSTILAESELMEKKLDSVFLKFEFIGIDWIKLCNNFAAPLLCIK